MPTVHPGGRVQWRSPQTPFLDDARTGKRADISNLYNESSTRRADLASLGQNVERVAELMARQQLGTSMGLPPKVTPQPSPLMLHIAGLDRDPRPRTNGSSRSMRAATSMGSLDAKGGGVLSLDEKHAKPATRASVMHLEATLRGHLEAAQDSLVAQVRAWDATFTELVRQVRLHCTERGDLLDEVRARYDDWITRLICTVSELHGARDRKAEVDREAATQQEDRLQELLLANQGLAHKVSVLKRELEWNRKATELLGGSDAKKQNKSAKSAAEGGAEGGGGGGEQSRVATKLGTLISMLSEMRDELSPSQIGALLRVVLDDSRARVDAAQERREEIVTALLEYLPLAAQQDVVLDMIAIFTPESLSTLVGRLADDASGGLGALTTLHELATERLGSASSASPEKLKLAKLAHGAPMAAADGVQQQIEALLQTVAPTERASILSGLSAQPGVAAPAGAPPPPLALPTQSAPPVTPAAPQEGQSKLAKRRETRKQLLGSAAVTPAAPADLLGEATSLLDEERKTSTIGAASVAEILRNRQFATAELTDAEVYGVIGGALAMKLETDAASRVFGRPRLHARDELWRHLCSQHTRRSEAVQALHNLAAAFEKRAQDNSGRNAPNRITAFRSLTGMATAAGSVWPAPQADFYFLALQALFPAWGTMSRAQAAAALCTPDILVSAEQVEKALRYLVRDGTLLIRLNTRVKGAVADKMLTSTGKAAGVDLDWLMQVLMQAWEDSQLQTQKALMTVFFDADDNGDGILQLDEFHAMIRDRKPDATEAEAFRIYDEALALSEVMLGYETDAILADAFVRTAMGHALFADVAQPLRTADDSVENPPDRWDGGGGGIAAGGVGGVSEGAPAAPKIKGSAARQGTAAGAENAKRDTLREAIGGQKRATSTGTAIASRVAGSSSMPQLPPAMGATTMAPAASAGFNTKLAGTNRLPMKR